MSDLECNKYRIMNRRFAMRQRMTRDEKVAWGLLPNEAGKIQPELGFMWGRHLAQMLGVDDV